MNESRENWIDTAKGIAIFLVVLGHTIRGVSSSGLPLNDLWIAVDSRIYAFYMPLFFALSGWFYIRTITKGKPLDFAANRLERLLYPLFLWTYIFFAFKIFAGDLANTPIDWHEIPLVPIPGVLHFWFLWDLLVLSCLAFPLRFTMREGRIPGSVWLLSFVFVIVLRFLPLPADLAPWISSAINNAPYFLLGAMLGHSGKRPAPTPFGLITSSAVFLLLLTFWPTLSQTPYGSVVSFVLVVCALVLLRGFEPHFPANLRSALAILGVASMAIYVAHTIFSAGLRVLLFSAGVVNPTVHILLGTTIGIIGPVAMLAIARRVGSARVLGLETRAVPLNRLTAGSA